MANKGNSIYISNLVTIELQNSYKISQASNNFNSHVCELNYFSHHYGLPTTNIGNDFKSFFDAEAGVEFYGVRFFKHVGIGKILNIICENVALYVKILRRDELNVWFYNLWTNTLIVFLLLRFFSTKKTYILLADYNPHRSNKIIDNFILWCHRKANAVLSLSSRCRNTNNKFYSIPGIIPKRNINFIPGTLTGSHNFLFSGTISKDNGIEMAIEVFSKIPKAKLTITGLCSEEIQKKCAKYKNINCRGYISDYADYLKILNSSDYLLSWRDPSQPVNNYNFPSKILETLAGNRTAVISTIKYEELDGINYFYEEYDEQKLFKLITDIISGDFDSYTQQCLNNGKALVEKYSEEIWVKTIKEIENNN